MSTTPTSSRGAGSSELQSDIRQTRREMDDTIDALGERLKPRHLLDDFLDMFRSPDSTTGHDVAQTASHMGKRLVRQVGSHPMPAILIGAGIAWLLMEHEDDEDADEAPRRRRGSRCRSSRSARSQADLAANDPYVSYADDWVEDDAEEFSENGGSSLTERAKGMLGQAKDTLSSAADSVRETVAGATSTVRETASHTAERASAAGRRVRRSTASAGRQAQHGYDYSRETLSDAMDEYPLAVGAATLGLGLLVGFALPRTRGEDQLMGETSDEIMDRAKAVGEQLLEQGRHAAESAVSAGTEEAQRQGLSTGEIGQKVKQVASRVMEAAKQEGGSLGAGPQQGGPQAQSGSPGMSGQGSQSQGSQSQGF